MNRINLKYIAFAIIIYCYLQYAFLKLPGSFLLSNIDDVLIFILIGLTLILKIKSGNFKINKNPYLVFTALFSASFVISFLYNRTPVLIGLIAFKSYFAYLMFFLALIELREFVDISKSVIRIVMAMFLGQLFIILPFALFTLLSGHRMGDDGFGGTFPGANNLSYSVIFPLLFVTYNLFVNKQKTQTRLFVGLFLVLIIPKGDYAILFYAIALSGIILFKMFKSKYVLKRVILFSLPVTVIFILFIGLRETTRNGNLFNPFELYNWITKSQTEVTSGSTRPLFYPLTFINLRSHAKSPIFGFGPGMYASYVAFRFMPPPNDLVFNAFKQIEHGFDPDVDSQIIPIWGELGYFGLFIFLLFFIYLTFKFSIRFFKTRNNDEKAYLFTLSLGSFFMLIGFYINHFWESQPLLVTYLLFVFLYLDWRHKMKLHITNPLDHKPPTRSLLLT